MVQAPPPPPRPYDPSPYVAPPSPNYLGLHAPPPAAPAAWAAYDRAAAMRTNPDRKSGEAQAALGAVILVIGMVVTFGTGGGIIAYGAIIVGLIQLISGVAKM